MIVIPDWLQDLSSIKALKVDIGRYKGKIKEAEDAIAYAISIPENHQFDSLSEAEGCFEDYFLDVAREACEGSYRLGLDQYSQEFFVKDQRYRFIIDVEYNRHDKTYYYIDGYKIRTEEINE